MSGEPIGTPSPEEVRVITPDGREFACDVLRDPDGDRDGCAMWVAVPREEIADAAGVWQLACGMLPPKSMISLRHAGPSPREVSG